MKTKRCSYEEFLVGSEQLLADAVITGGLLKMKETFRFEVMQWYNHELSRGNFEFTQRKDKHEHT